MRPILSDHGVNKEQKQFCITPRNEPFDKGELAEKIRRMAGFEGEIVWDASKPDGQPRRCLDTSRARERFGFEAETGFDEGLRRTIDWWRSKTRVE